LKEHAGQFADTCWAALALVHWLAVEAGCELVCPIKSTIQLGSLDNMGKLKRHIIRNKEPCVSPPNQTPANSECTIGAFNSSFNSSLAVP
jgi:hypothetical protein